jgi:hypothetical protein
VQVPANAKPGQWVGGIVSETSRQVTGAKSKQKASVQIKIRDLTIVAVQVNVPGPPVIAFKIGGVTTGGQRGFQQVVTHISNTGNVLAKPTGSVTVLNKQGAVLQVLPFKMDTFLPQTSIDYPLLLKKALPAGDYSAKVTLSVPGVSGAAAEVVSAHPAFSISKQDVQQVFTSATPQAAPPGTSAASTSSKPPWILITAGVVVALLLVLLLLRLLRGRRGGAVGEATSPVQRSTSAAGADASPAVSSIVEWTEPLPPASPPLPPEPGPEPAPAPAPTSVPAPPPAPEQTRRAECDQHHFWEVAYDRGQLGEDGVWRFPHRCRNCGLELLARDVDDATAQADALHS